VENLEVVVNPDKKALVMEKVSAVIDSFEPDPIVGIRADYPGVEILVYKRVWNGAEVVVAAMANGASIVSKI